MGTRSRIGVMHGDVCKSVYCHWDGYLDHNGVILQENYDSAKANHLAYLGDATVGERVNYGAGSITANYDGAHKHRTVIEADVHVGRNCVLVAPVTLGAGGTIGGGSTITKDTPPGALSVARGKQISVTNWQRPRKDK